MAIDDPRTVETLVAELQEKPWWDVPDVIEALSRTKDARAIGPLVAMLQYENKQAGKHLGDETIKHVEEIRQKAIDALATLGHPDVIEAMISAMKSTSFLTRAGALRVLGRVGDSMAIDDPRKVEILIAELQHDRWSARAKAIEDLSRTKDARAIGPLVAMLQYNGEHSQEIRQKAIDALATLGHPNVVKAMVSAVKNTDYETRAGALRVLGRVGGSEALPVIATAFLSEAYGYVVVAAALALLSAIQKGASIDQPSEIVSRALRSLQANNTTYNTTIEGSDEKIAMAALVENVVPLYSTDIETGLLAKIEALCDFNIPIVEEYGSDSGITFDYRKTTRSLQFAKARLAARSELARRRSSV